MPEHVWQVWYIGDRGRVNADSSVQVYWFIYSHQDVSQMQEPRRSLTPSRPLPNIYWYSTILHFCSIASWWRRGVEVECRTRDQEVAGTSLGRALRRKNSGQVSHTSHLCASVTWWEVVAAHHRVHDYACCHLQADCLESGISYGPLRSITSMGKLPFPFIMGRYRVKRGFQPSAPNARSKTRLARELERSNLMQAISRDKFQPCYWPLLGYVAYVA